MQCFGFNSTSHIVQGPEMDLNSNKNLTGLVNCTEAFDDERQRDVALIGATSAAEAQ